LVNSKRALTATTLLGVFGIGWAVHASGARAFVSLVLTTALSLYGALALGLNAWSPFVVELVLTMGMAWALFVKPEPVE
jgi:hypothetical protein